jgi:uncharacterized protein
VGWRLRRALVSSGFAGIVLISMRAAIWIGQDWPFGGDIMKFLSRVSNRSAAVRPSEALGAHRAEIRKIVADHHAANARIFGSVVSGDDDENSDLDLLIDPTPETTLFDIARIQRRVQALLGVSVDVLTPLALPESFRAKVVSEAVPV